MFTLNKENELNISLLQKMINSFNINIYPKLEKRKKYYDGIQDILHKTYNDETKPCSHTVINYCKNIVDSYCGYLATPGFISYTSSEDIEDIMDILKYNDYQTEDSDLLLDALIYGVSAELMYIDDKAQTRFRLIDPKSCFGIYDDSLTGDLMYFVRMYKATEWDMTDLYYLDVYSDVDIKHYKMNGTNGYVEFISDEPHYFSQCPANILVMPDEKGIFDCIMTLQDAVNELLSSEIDDYSAFCDAYLTITGADLDAEDVAIMKENRVLVLPEGATASWLTKSANDAQVENILKRIHDSIYRVAQCPDFSSESFVGGVSSGIAIQYRLTGMENRAGIIEGRMKKALLRRCEIISGIASLTLGEDLFREINIIFKRNLPLDINEVINTVNGLRGIVSDETLIAQVPFIDNADAEIEKIKAQKQENMELYSFGNFSEETEEEE